MKYQKIGIWTLVGTVTIFESISYGVASPSSILAVALLGGIYLKMVELQNVTKQMKDSYKLEVNPK